MATLDSLFNSVDNSHEPLPAWNKPSTIMATVIVSQIVSGFCVIFRLYTRFRIVRSPGWDDLFVVLVLISTTVGTFCICTATYHGLGSHFASLTITQMKSYLRLFYVANGTYSMSTTFVKLGLLLQYLRVYKRGALRQTSIVVAVITGIWGSACMFMAWFPCFPISGYWNFDQKAKCYGFGDHLVTRFYAMYLTMSATNMVLDIVILIIPVPLYFRAETPSQTKLGLLGLLVMGALVNFLSIWRVATIVQHRAASLPTFDPSWYGPISVLLSSLEVDVATICASVPVFWPILTSGLDQIFVTKEIKIERTHQFANMDEAYEMGRESSGSRPTSPTTSQSNLKPPERSDVKLCMASTASMDAHYRDKYIQAQVDPFDNTGVKLEITAQKGGQRLPKI